MFVPSFVHPTFYELWRSGDLRQSLCPVREFSGDAEIVKGWKPVPQRNMFRTATRIAWRTRQILAEFAFRSEPEFCASVLCGHAESRPLGVPPQRFRRVSEAHAAVVGVEIRPNLVAHLANPLIFTHPPSMRPARRGLARKPGRSEPSVAMAEATVATGTKCIAKIWV